MTALNFPIDPTDGDVYDNYVWVAALDAWRRLPIDPAIPLGNLEDVTLTTPSLDEVLKYDGTGWVNGPDEGGKILQVVSTTKTDVFSEAVAGGGISADIMTVTITPSSATSNLFVVTSLNVAHSGGGVPQILSYRNGSVSAFAGDAGSGQKRGVGTIASGGDVAQNLVISFSFLDTAGSTSATTYSVRIANNTSAQTMYVNRSKTDNPNTSYVRGASSITVMEVAG